MQRLLILSFGLIVISVIGVALIATTRTGDTAWATFPGSATTPYPIDAVFQPFEHGMMIWRGDYNCVYALADSPNPEASSPDVIIPAELPENSSGNIHGYGYCLNVDVLVERSVPLPTTPDLLMPQGAMGLVWRYYAAIHDKLGYAVGPETAYVATVPRNDEVYTEMPFYWPQLTLPDDRLLKCGSRGASAGTCAVVEAGSLS